MAEFIVYNTALSDEDRESVEGYLHKKWFEEPVVSLGDTHRKKNFLNVQSHPEGIRLTNPNLGHQKGHVQVWNLKGEVIAQLNQVDNHDQATQMIPLKQKGLVIITLTTKNEFLQSKIVLQP